MASNTAMSEREIPDEAIRQSNEITMKQLVDKIYNDLDTPNAMHPINNSDLDGFLSTAVGLHFNGVNHPIADGNLKNIYNTVKKKLRLPRAREMITNLGNNVKKKKMVIENIALFDLIKDLYLVLALSKPILGSIGNVKIAKYCVAFLFSTFLFAFTVTSWIEKTIQTLL